MGAFMAGFPNTKFEFRGQKYEYSFGKMKQINVETRKERDIRPPYGWKQPAKPIVPSGPTTTVTVPTGPNGKPPKQFTIPHPKDKNETITVNVPPKARPGQAMLVPVPPLKEKTEGGKEGGGWSTGAKVAAGAAGTGMVVAGA